MAEIQVEQAPRKAREQYDKAFAAFERGNYDFAMDMFQLALEVCPQLTKARKLLRLSQIKKFRADGRGGGLADAMSSLSGIGAMMSGSSLLKKDPAKAVVKAEELLRKNPLNPQFVKFAVDAAMAAGMPEAAIVTLEAYVENKPGDIAVMRQLAKLFQEVSRMHEARLVYEEVAKLKPADPKAIKDLKDATALDSMQRGNWEDRSADFRSKLKSKDESLSLEREAKAVKSDRDADALISETLLKIQREPQNVNYRRGLAELYTRADRFDEALAVLAEAQQVSGGVDPQLDRLAGNIRTKKFDFEIGKLRDAGKAAEADEMARAKIAFLLTDLEDKVKRYPNDLQFRYDFGVALFEAGKLTEATQQFQLAAKNPQRRIRSLYYLALCFKAKNLFDLALEQLEKAAAELPVLDDTKKDVLYELAAVHDVMGKPEKALALYKDIYSVDVGYRDVAQKIENAYRK